MKENPMCKKAINFDLDTKALKGYYPGKHYKKAYKDIKKFLCAEGFKHRQWSGYISDTPLSDTAIKAKIIKMTRQIPWLKDCVRRFDVTDVGEQYDLTQLITKTEIDNSKGAELAHSKASEFLLAFSKSTKAIKKSYSKTVECECVVEESQSQGSGRGR